MILGIVCPAPFAFSQAAGLLDAGLASKWMHSKPGGWVFKKLIVRTIVSLPEFMDFSHFLGHHV